MELNFLQSVIEGTKEPSKLPFHLLQLITDNFSEEQRIGSGGFSGIFKVLLLRSIRFLIARFNVI